MDDKKNKLLEELMVRYECITQQLEEATATRDPELQVQLRQVQAEKRVYQKQLQITQTAVGRDPFIVLLIDGDGMIFQKEFLRDGSAGGHRAAVSPRHSAAWRGHKHYVWLDFTDSVLQTKLRKFAESYVDTEDKAIPVESRILCRIYASVKGLADVLVRSGAIEHAAVFEEFVQGFTRGDTLFDFIDVGPGKDRADDKIIENFKIHINNLHCRKIFFGCSHDNGFARMLEKYMTEPYYVSKVTLLEGVPFEKELQALPYATKKFQGIFRESKINLQGATYGQLSVANTPSPAPKTYNIITGIPTHFPPPTGYRSMGENDGLGDSPMPAQATADMWRTPSSSTLASDGLPVTAKPILNWAARAAAPPPPSSPKPNYEPVSREEMIARNRHGQRVDPATRDYDKAEVDRVKTMKLCNVHFLRQECPFKDNYTHVHDYKPSSGEIATLRLVARMAPCQNGSGCQDVKCMYGHRCPAPYARNVLDKGKKPCIFGEACKFPIELHDLDCNVVKTLVIR